MARGTAATSSERIGPERWRLFMAVPVPAAARGEIERSLAPYRRAHPTARWLRPDTWHVTMLFLGSVDVARVPELASILDATVVNREPTAVSVIRGDGRVGRRDAVAWLRIADGAGYLLSMADQLRHTCPSDVGSTPPKRTPSAHLTVARKVDEPLISSLRSETLGPLRAGWIVDRAVLVRSHLGPGGSRYETLHESAM